MLRMTSPIKTAKLRALDLITANIMIADADLNIAYMNSATRGLLKEAEEDLRKELPRFSLSSLIGSNIDIFHKNPTHQRTMLAALKTQHRATIWIGQRIFDLIVTPLMEKNRSVGFVVEWADAKARIQNTDFRNQLLAISRVQAVIEFAPNGDIVAANENFLKTMGYTFAEIQGRNHRMFLEPGATGDQLFKQLWADLASNKAHIGDIVRYGKNGKQIFLNAAYNPITDDSGKVVKVVKFANDVGDRVFSVRTIGEALSKLAAGNLDFSLDHSFAADFEALRVNMNEALGQLGSTLVAVSRSSEMIDGGAREISESSSDLSRRTEQQAAALEETAAALDQITANVVNASRRAEEARQATEAADASANHSGQIVADAVAAMARIEQSSNQISSIIGVIDEIAFQTNLLALNAGVEAARAGEAGKGFAVVAQEVRELAQRSAKAAKEIKELIRSSSEEVRSGVKLVSETGDALRKIQGNISTVNQHMQAIAVSAREQSTGLSEVNSAVNQMDQVTQQNAAMVEESTATAASLAQEAEALRHLIARFQLETSSSQTVQTRPQFAGRRAAITVSPKVSRPVIVGNTAVEAGEWQEF
ncbi:methyl-accepting chemotaxis protein [Rhizobium sp. WW_1]|jgi:PAS domain S-box-containing protein|uniref:methyl-accepting chemotaxis protein n=1 Tax=Rhizobium sp. WW_1 TaxID=1907375 RepID=UPI000648BF6E|nr:methyl-accepting chemotaxis protein [Rhizobium sp. WW_1]RKD35945.1 methyl-accepting chemotaxis sensory transducer with Pas/Pac sensor [Rhizobium sp. WW_1]